MLYRDKISYLISFIILIFSFFPGLALGEEDNILIKQANKWEMDHCQEVTNSLARFIVDDRKHAAHGRYNTDLKSIYTTFAVVPEDAFLTSFLVTGANAKQGCSGTYLETGVVDKKCSIAKEEIFSDWEYEGSLGNQTLVLSHKQLNLYLTPSPNNTCLVQKRELSVKK